MLNVNKLKFNSSFNTVKRILPRSIYFVFICRGVVWNFCILIGRPSYGYTWILGSESVVYFQRRCRLKHMVPCYRFFFGSRWAPFLFQFSTLHPSSFFKKKKKKQFRKFLFIFESVLNLFKWYIIIKDLIQCRLRQAQHKVWVDITDGRQTTWYILFRELLKLPSRSKTDMIQE